MISIDLPGVDNVIIDVLKEGGLVERLIGRGSWITAANKIRFANRHKEPSDTRKMYIGFRIVRTQ